MRHLAVLVALLGMVATSRPQDASSKAEGVGPFLTQFCIKCHGPEKPKGGLSLHDLSPNPDVGMKLLDALLDRQMPPEKALQPTPEQRRRAIQAIQASLAKAGVRVDARPSKGNRVDHEALFSAKAGSGAATPARLWRVTAPAYEEFFQKVNAELRLGYKSYGRPFRSPWELSDDEGFRDYASTHRIDEPEIEMHLRNATKVAKVLAGKMVQAGKSSELQAGADKGVRALLGRDPSKDERERYATFFQESLKRDGAEKALELLFVAVLFHPEVLYRLETASGLLAPRDLARAIAFALTDRAPDAELLQAAADGRLSRREEIRSQVRRILDAEMKRILGNPVDAEPRLIRFFREYFGYAEAEHVFKDKATLNAAGLGGRRNYWTPSFFVRDADRLVAAVLDRDEKVLHELLTTTKIPVLTRVSKNGRELVHPSPKGIGFSAEARLALAVYELDLKPQEWTVDKAFALPEGHRLGMLTHPAWLVAHSTNFENHAIGRGRWIREKLLGGNIPDIPVTVDAKLPDEPEKPLRERMRVTRDAYCWTCHRNMDPLGLPFEMFDHFGRFRATELGKPVDAAGAVERSGDGRLDGPVKDALELIRKLAASERVEQVFVRHVFRYFVGRNETLEDGPTLVEAHRAYAQGGGSMKALIVSLLTSDAFLVRTTEGRKP